VETLVCLYLTNGVLGKENGKRDSLRLTPFLEFFTIPFYFIFNGFLGFSNSLRRGVLKKERTRSFWKQEERYEPGSAKGRSQGFIPKKKFTEKIENPAKWTRS
jgi:hypothetical protein